MKTIVFGLLIVSNHCSLFHPQEKVTPLVRSVQEAGAGPLAGLKVEEISQWLNRHQPVAMRVKKECAGIFPEASAAWNASTEGHLCMAAVQSTFFTYVRPQSDHYVPPTMSEIMRGVK